MAHQRTDRFRGVRATAEYQLRGARNWKTLYYGFLLEPYLYYLLLGVGLSSTMADGGAYLAFLLCGMVPLIGIRAWSMSLGDAANGRKWGTYARLRLAGYSTASYSSGVLFLYLAIGLFQIATISLLAMIFVPGLSLAKVGSLVVAAALLMPFWIMLGIALGLRVDSYSQRDLIRSMFALPLVFGGSLLFPTDHLPTLLKVLAYANPATYQADLVRWFYGDHAGLPLGLLVAVCVGLYAVPVVLLSLTSRHQESWISAEMA